MEVTKEMIEAAHKAFSTYYYGAPNFEFWMKKVLVAALDAAQQSVQRTDESDCICGYDKETGYRTDILCPVHDRR